MLDGLPVVFLSCSERFKERVAYPMRDALERAGYRAVLVSDAPRLGDAFTPEEKVEAYLRLAEAFIALLTPDEQVEAGSFRARDNIFDEIGRARSIPALRGRVMVFKHPDVRLPSNIDPAYDPLDLDDIAAAAKTALVQLERWGIEGHPPVVSHARGVEPAPVFAGLRIEDPRTTEEWVRSEINARTKAEQQAFVESMLQVVRTADRWEHRGIAGHVLEAVEELDVGLLSNEVIEELGLDADETVRMSAAVILFLRARQAPGLVPIDLVTRLARPSAESWYVFTPALNALKVLSMSRPEAMVSIAALAMSTNRDDREYAASALQAIARIRPQVVPVDAVRGLMADGDPSVAELGARVWKMVKDIPEDERNRAYSPFSAY